MSSFSKRMKLEPTIPIQKNAINNELKNRLWNAIKDFLAQGIESRYGNISTWQPGGYSVWHPNVKPLIYKIWDAFFKLPTDGIAQNPDIDMANIKKFFDSCDWNKCYDFLEFIALILAEKPPLQEHFIASCNKVLNEENSAYRFYNAQIIAIIPEQELQSIESALVESPDKVQSHLKKAFNLLSHRQMPDYANSAKESICAVEALFRHLVNSQTDTLGDILKKNQMIKSLFHPQLHALISNLYNYRGDRSAVGHASKEGYPDVTREEALFVLVISSAICNYTLSLNT